jgi:NitT/TauT family transport system substrate-binding protein
VRPSSAPSVSPDPGETLRPITLRLRGALGTDAGGYVTAVAQGYYESAGLEVSLVPTDPATAMPARPDDAEFIVSWVPAVLIAREREGSDLVDIAQIAQRSGTLSLAWRETGITVPGELAGQRLGILAPNADPEIVAATLAAGLAAGDPTTVAVGSGVGPFLARDVDALQVLIYDGYAQVLEATDPATSKLYPPTALDVINYTDHDTAMLQDAIFASAAWLAEDDHAEVATAFLAASFRGWVACRDDPEACITATTEAFDTVGASASPSPGTEPSAEPSAAPSSEPAPRPGDGHLAWMLNEYHPLVWPSPDGLGMVEAGAWAATVDALLAAGLLTTTPSPDAVRTDLAAAALAELEDLDTTGMTFEKGLVDITRDGE